jgi:hypothetical protein
VSWQCQLGTELASQSGMEGAEKWDRVGGMVREGTLSVSSGLRRDAHRVLGYLTPTECILVTS